MNRKTMRMKKITSMLLALTIILSGAFITPITAQAAGWLGHEQNLILGQTVTNSLKTGDKYDEDGMYCNPYKFTMPQDGLLNIHFECSDEQYFYNAMELAIYHVSDPDRPIWTSEQNMEHDYSGARGVHYASKEIALNQADYYFVLSRYAADLDTPYYLTLSYKEPNVNVTSISLDKKSIKLEPGEQDTLIATVLPDNATDKTIVWESSEPSTASIENGVVTAISPGTSTITAASADGEITASCLVTVIDTAAIDELEEAKPAITSLTAARKKVTVYFSSIGISDVKYQVAYKTGSGAWKIKNTASTSATIRSLKSKKTYSIRIRGYKNIDGKVYYSGWSAVKQIKIK